MVCTIDSEPVLRQRCRVGTSEPRPQKRSKVEVESESESGEDGEKLDEVEKALVGIQEALEEQNVLHPEGNWYLRGIMPALQEGNKLLSREPVDSTLKE